MLDLILAGLALQAAPPPGPDPCHAGPPERAPAQCPRWRQVQLQRNSEASGYVDPASLRRDGNAIELNTLTVLAVPMEGNVSRFIVRARLDCTARTSLVLHVTTFDAAGRVIDDSDVPEATPQPSPAGSPRAALMDEFCPR